MKKQSVIVWTVVALGFCLVLSACPKGDENNDEKDNEKTGPTVINRVDLTEIVEFPVVETRRPEAVNKHPQFSGTIEWLDSEDGASFIEAYGMKFFEDYYYRAVLSLTAEKGFTFNKIAANSFTHQKAVVTNPAGNSESLTVTVTFPKTPAAGVALISQTNLSPVIAAPLRGGTPQLTADHAQYSAAIAWKTEDDAAHSGPFQASTAYKAVVALTAKPGFTASGLVANSFSYAGARSVVYSITDSTVTILFNPTAAEGAKEIVTQLDLTALVAAPVYRKIPVPTIDSEQYTGTVSWFYVVNPVETPVTGKFDCGKGIKAVVSLTAKDDFTFTGVGANVFTHDGSSAVSNAAGSGNVTISFAAAPWNPGVITYPSLASSGYGATAKACCWPAASATGANNPGLMVNLANPTSAPSSTNYWDYGYNGSAASNGTSWTAIFKGSITMNGDECGHGHPSALLKESVPEGIRKTAHVFTFDLQSVRDNIVSFGMYPRQNESAAERGQRWPIQFELFYSDSDIDPVSVEGATSLGVFQWNWSKEWPWPTTADFAWRDIDLTPYTANNRGISARYLHLRVYADNKNGLNSEWVTPSIGQIRIGIAEDDI